MVSPGSTIIVIDVLSKSFAKNNSHYFHKRNDHYFGLPVARGFALTVGCAIIVIGIQLD